MKVDSRASKWICAAVDFVAVALATVGFNLCRYWFYNIHSFMPKAGLWRFMLSKSVVAEELIFPLVMLSFFWLSGHYVTAMRGSRLKDFTNAAGNSAVGALIFFFIAMLNDTIPMRRWSYELVLCFWLLLTVCVTAARWILSALRNHSAALRPTLIIGIDSRAADLARRLERARRVMGLDVIGFVSESSADLRELEGIPVYRMDSVGGMIESGKVDVLVVSADPADSGVMEIVRRFLPYKVSVMLWADSSLPSLARRSFDNVAGEPLVDVSQPPMPTSTLNIKRVFDVAVSAIALLLLSPILLAIAIAVKLDSPGPVFYRQRRVGFHRQPFDIIKFRSMRTDAESLSGPALSSPEDPRITRVGHYLRKYRLDELPNFINVLRGEMSLVGPRPEREFFLSQIMERTPLCALIHRVRPGITSWGMVKYGYAQNVDQMVERLRYDLVYVENVSLRVDMKILFYTIHTVITGKGL